MKTSLTLIAGTIIALAGYWWYAARPVAAPATSVPAPAADKAETLVDNAATTSVHWLTDFEEATARAKAEQKPMLLLFTGSGWCGVCTILEKEVFEQPEFVDVAKRVVLMKVDFEEAPYKVELEDIERDPKLALAARFDINIGQERPDGRGLHGYPTVFILSPDGARAADLKLRLVDPNNSKEMKFAELEKQLAAMQN